MIGKTVLLLAIAFTYNVLVISFAANKCFIFHYFSFFNILGNQGEDCSAEWWETDPWHFGGAWQGGVSSEAGMRNRGCAKEEEFQVESKDKEIHTSF